MNGRAMKPNARGSHRCVSAHFKYFLMKIVGRQSSGGEVLPQGLAIAARPGKSGLMFFMARNFLTAAGVIQRHCGDDTALPAISRRLAELPAGARAELLLEVDGPADHIAFESAAEIKVVWVHRGSTVAGDLPLLDALRRMRMPAGFFSMRGSVASRRRPKRCARIWWRSAVPIQNVSAPRATGARAVRRRTIRSTHESLLI